MCGILLQTKQYCSIQYKTTVYTETNDITAAFVQADVCNNFFLGTVFHIPLTAKLQQIIPLVEVTVTFTNTNRYMACSISLAAFQNSLNEIAGLLEQVCEIDKF